MDSEWLQSIEETEHEGRLIISMCLLVKSGHITGYNKPSNEILLLIGFDN